MSPVLGVGVDKETPDHVAVDGYVAEGLAGLTGSQAGDGTLRARAESCVSDVTLDAGPGTYSGVRTPLAFGARPAGPHVLSCQADRG
jgi:hypothetical protein